MAVNNEDYINQIYDQAQKKQNAALEQAYNESISGLDASKVANQKATDANLTRTYTEANKAQQGFNEVQNAQGLSSGAMAQSQLARDTQLQQDLTTLRAAQASADADIERQRNLLGQQYASQLQQAAASNDIERIKMIYQAAKDEEDKLNAQKVEAGKAIYSYNKNIIPYLQALGMTDEEIKAMGISQPSSGGGGWAPAQKPNPETGGGTINSIATTGVSAGVSPSTIYNSLIAGGASKSEAQQATAGAVKDKQVADNPFRR